MNLMEVRLKPDYNCAHFVADAWEAEGLGNIRETLEGFLYPVGKRRVEPSKRSHVIKLDKPVSPCLVLFRRKLSEPHVGLYIRGRVLHLTDSGPIRQLPDIASMGYQKTRYYAIRPVDN